MIVNGNALHIPLADGTVQTCVTSPPYYGLRDYGTAEWNGGDPECGHTVSGWNDNLKPNVNRPERDGFKRQNCLKCGAVRVDDQIGLEETPEEYIEKMVSVFREVKRVLRDDGTCWVNMGDSYSGSGKGDNPEGKQGTNKGTRFESPTSGLIPNGCKPKDLMGIPWMLAFALRADGWYLRSEIIWHKPNPMPESVTDRPTKAHEQIFLLSKNARYFYDADAVREPHSDNTHARGPRLSDGTIIQGVGKKNKRNDDMQASLAWSKTLDGSPQQPHPLGRNRRTVWTVATKPYSGAHFATFPPDLIEPCILAGSKEGDVVLDPFSGSGTTGEVSIKHRRRYFGLELNREYIDLSKKRTTVDVMLPGMEVR